VPEGPTLVILGGFSIRIHFLMFGRWCIDERKDLPPRLSLAFARKRELNFYNCAVRYIEGDLDDEYDWRGDVMSDAWDARPRPPQVAPQAGRARLRCSAGPGRVRRRTFDEGVSWNERTAHFLL
jgi:hypothetical protein